MRTQKCAQFLPACTGVPFICWIFVCSKTDSNWAAGDNLTRGFCGARLHATRSEAFTARAGDSLLAGDQRCRTHPVSKTPRRQETAHRLRRLPPRGAHADDAAGQLQEFGRLPGFTRISLLEEQRQTRQVLRLFDADPTSSNRRTQGDARIVWCRTRGRYRDCDGACP